MSTTTHRTRRPLRFLVGALLPALLLVGCATDEADPAAGPPEAPQQLMPPPADEHAETPDGVPIAELADADWVDDVASEHAIPRRAMAAYAGAAPGWMPKG